MRDIVDALPGFVTIVRVALNYSNGTVLPGKFNGKYPMHTHMLEN